MWPFGIGLIHTWVHAGGMPSVLIRVRSSSSSMTRPSGDRYTHPSRVRSRVMPAIASLTWTRPASSAAANGSTTATLTAPTRTARTSHAGPVARSREALTLHDEACKDLGVSLASWFVARTLKLPPPHDTAVNVERDVRVSMDDGVVLLADIYTPAGTGPHPTILVRSPYGRRPPLGLVLGRLFAERSYRVVMQSCRGTYGSGGVFEPNFNERADGLATIRWVEQQPWFDGRLAMNGPSYLGGVQWAVADDAGPVLKAL